MPRPVLKALAAQAASTMLILLLGRSAVIPPLEPLPLACLQGVLAACMALLLRSPRWWFGIHLVFMPLVAVAAVASLPAWVYGLGFVVLLGIYWTTFKTQVPLFLSNRITVHRLAAWLPDDKPLHVLDVGSGTGAFVTRLACLRPNWPVSGIESAPAPFLVSRWLARHRPNVHVMRADFWKHDIAGYDVIYAFLSPVPMRELWRKARREMRPGAWLVSNSFPIPELEPQARVHVDDARGTHLYCYRIPGSQGRQDTAQERSRRRSTQSQR